MTSWSASRRLGTNRTLTCTTGLRVRQSPEFDTGQVYRLTVPKEALLAPVVVQFHPLSPLDAISVPETPHTPVSRAQMLVLVGESIYGSYAAPSLFPGLEFMPTYPIHSSTDAARLFRPVVHQDVRFLTALVH
jgi:hypothetical protein